MTVLGCMRWRRLWAWSHQSLFWNSRGNCFGSTSSPQGFWLCNGSHLISQCRAQHVEHKPWGLSRADTSRASCSGACHRGAQGTQNDISRIKRAEHQGQPDRMDHRLCTGPHYEPKLAANNISPASIFHSPKSSLTLP